MILHQNSIIQLNYNPATDILDVKYPDLQRLFLSEIQESLKLMVETIRSYDVKNLLLDASTTRVELSDADNRNLTLHLAAELSNTRLVKVARIKPIDPIKEIKAQENILNLERSRLLPYQLRTFSDRAEALAWLTGNVKSF